MLIGRYRRYAIVAITSLAGSLAFVFVFMRIVYVSLPLGVGPFQKLSLWILAVLGVH
jgi:putative tricarboxylic transport membrane protein